MSELISQMQAALRTGRYSRRTEKAYCGCVRRYVRFHGLRHPADMAEPEINAFVTHLAVVDKVSASTQTRALSAILFLYRHVLHREVGELTELARARKSAHLPVVLTREEVRLLLDNLDGDVRLVASLLYGAGLRLSEGLRLRVLDLDITASELLHGVHRATQPDVRARRSALVEGVLERFPLLAVDLACARAHAQLWAGLSRAGMLIGPHDLWLAATCIAHGLTMVTGSVREFARVPGLEFEVWEG